MKYFATLSDLAEIDLAESNEYFMKIRSDLLERFWDDLDQTMEKLEENPLQFQERYQHTRIAFLKNFPFGIHFIINEKEIDVLRILHAKREF